MEAEFLDDAVNRSVLVVKPAEPFKRWAAKTEEAMLAEIRHSPSAEELQFSVMLP